MPNPGLDIEEKILDAAEQCFEQYGIAKTTIKDVAEVAGVSHMTIYRKFVDRDALFAATSLRLLNRRWAGIAEGLQSIDNLLLEYLEFGIPDHRYQHNFPMVLSQLSSH